MTPKENKEIDEKILQELECPVCNQHMTPIFICKTGHSICSDCMKRVSLCPNCCDSFSRTRNFTLEKLTSRVNYPCRNKDQGYSFVTTSDKILSHQQNCELSEHPCVFKCGWQGQRFSIYNHLKLIHPQSLCGVNNLQICDTRDKEMFYFLYEYGQLFIFSLRQDAPNSPKKFNVQ
ncbi:probable E3 ubiquitin-protein ligase sinah [Anoplophora glabripennis]|uniref:probable E3 ubiquitin-protein ligase sinah n=1 Tax=Anoplophora glabripennis TaxID=217634 RepID=UPI000874428A|nr:probable E3 ubiquitin-protein ligase sinah [Anoplophora glabripennis]